MFKIFNRGISVFTDNFSAFKVNGTEVLDKDGNIGAALVKGAALTAKKGYFSVAVDTNGTTAVDVFGASGAPVALTVTSVVSVAKDTTAGNITLKQAANTVVTIAKGTSAGVLVGGTSLSHTDYAPGDACTVVSSSSGNSTVIITFAVA